MNKRHTKIYVKVTPEKNEIVYSGINFSEFIKGLHQPIENILTITGGSNFILIDTKSERGLELFEGEKQVQKLTEKDISNRGNFCFVDFSSEGKTKELAEEQIAELLYFGHMFKPLCSPFFEILHNRFAYLSHDDGWYCKLFCKNLEDFAPILCGKIVASIDRTLYPPTDNIGKELLLLATAGILIDLDELSHEKEKICLNIYIIGECQSIDTIFNGLEETKKNAPKIYSLRGTKNDWGIYECALR